MLRVSWITCRARPGLAVVLVGDDPASHVYVRSKIRMARKLGLRGETKILPHSVTEDELLSVIATLNAQADIDGILVQLPIARAHRRVADHGRGRSGQGLSMACMP
jgi:5,10-methylene-tetrahydrofolate dehydrogenase/methenyl tetrahydrofolate cyclohydrolase